jgi:hypothetical protein
MTEKRRRRKKRSTSDKSPLHHWHVSHQQEKNMVTFLTTQWKGIFGHHEASHMLSKMRRHLPCTNECPTPANYILFIFISFFIKRLNWSSADMVITKKIIMKKHKKILRPFLIIFNFCWNFGHFTVHFVFIIFFYASSNAKLPLILHDNYIKTIMKI